MASFDELLSRLSAQTILCVGDLMLDEFVYGDVTRISPEAATPVISVRRRETQIGGAGNVARNIASLGAQCILVGIVGDDDAGRELTAKLAQVERIEPHIVVDATRPTTHKVRYVSEHHSTHLLRADRESATPASPEVAAALLEQALPELDHVDAVVLSDYAKGVLTPGIVRALIEAARSAGKPVVVDPKALDYGVYRGATVVTPNRKELAEVTRRALATVADVEAAAAELAELTESASVVVTHGEDGLSLHHRGGSSLHVPAHRVRVRDVTGAGDTVAATLAGFLAIGAELESAVRAANAAAAVVVGKNGTATATAAELSAYLLPEGTGRHRQKIVAEASALTRLLEEWRGRGLRIGFTNGCFDLLHPGHIKLLAEAKAACDRLIVGLNTDASVAGLKGAGRPIQGEQARAEVLAALESVDLVVMFDAPTPLELIRAIRPDLLVKGKDYAPHEVVGRDIVEANGGHLLLVELAPGHSTTELVGKALPGL